MWTGGSGSEYRRVGKDGRRVNDGLLGSGPDAGALGDDPDSAGEDDDGFGFHDEPETSTPGAGAPSSEEDILGLDVETGRRAKPGDGAVPARIPGPKGRIGGKSSAF